MSLYGNDDSNANKTKAGIGIGGSSQAKTVVFIDDTEAQLKSNKDRGLNTLVVVFYIHRSAWYHSP